MAKGHPYRDELVERIRYLLELHEISVTALEQESGRTRGYFGDALRGNKRLPIETIIEILEHLEIDPREFFSGETEVEKRWRLAKATKGEVIAEDPSTDLLTDLLSPGPRVDEVATVVRSLVRLLDQKGVATFQELRSELGEAGE